MKARLFVTLTLTLLIGTRLLHLANRSHYYLINADSFYFHFKATQLHDGLSVSLHNSGWVYALAASPDLMSILIPLIASLFTAALLYAFTQACYPYGKEPICTMFIFAICIPAIFIGSAGNVDRDSLELLLIIPILFALYNSGQGNTFNFIFSVIFAVLLLALLAYLWSWIAIPTVAVLIGPFAVFKAFRKETHYRLLILLILTLGPLYVLLSYQDFSSLLSQGVSELQYLDITGLVMYIPLCLPLTYGIITLKRRLSSIDVFLLFWLVTAFILGLMLSRMQLFLIPVVCIISGIGLWQFYADNKESNQKEVLSEPV